MVRAHNQPVVAAGAAALFLFNKKHAGGRVDAWVFVIPSVNTVAVNSGVIVPSVGRAAIVGRVDLLSAIRSAPDLCSKQLS